MSGPTTFLFGRFAVESFEYEPYHEAEYLEYRDPTALEVLEAANGLTDPNKLGLWIITKKREVHKL
jgi:hypothetical protein